MPFLSSLRLVMILLYFYFTLQLQLPLALTASFTTATTSSTTSYTSVMLHYSIRVVSECLWIKHLWKRSYLPIRIHRQRIPLCLPFVLRVFSRRKRYKPLRFSWKESSLDLFSKISNEVKSGGQIRETTKPSFVTISDVDKGGGVGLDHVTRQNLS